MRNSSWDMDVDDDISKSYRVFISVMSVLLVLIEVSGILCNTVILIIYYKYTRLRTATNLFILNLALCNLLLAILDIIFSAPSSFNREWLYGSAGCTAYGFSYIYLMAVSVSTLAVISFDRFCVITKPVRNLRPFVLTKKYSQGLIVFIHIYSLIFTLPPLFSWNKLVPDTTFQTGCYINYNDNEAPSLAYTIVFTMFTCILPFVLTTCCYFKIYISVKNSSKRSTINHRIKQKTISRGDSVPSLKKIKRRSLTHTRTAKMIAVVMFFFLLTWLPVKVAAICQAFGVAVPALVMYISVFLAKSCVMYNAVVYVFLNHRFRAAFLHLAFLCRDDSRLHMATSVTNHSGRFGDFGVSVSEHFTGKTRVSKNLSQLSIIPSVGLLDGSSTSAKTSVDVAKVFIDRIDDVNGGKTNSYYPNGVPVIGYCADRGLGLPATSYGCVNDVLVEEESEGSGNQKYSSCEEQSTASMPQDALKDNDDNNPQELTEFNGSLSSDVKPGAFCQENDIIFEDERNNEEFQELNVNSLNDIMIV